jgi:hypothetical protein
MSTAAMAQWRLVLERVEVGAKTLTPRRVLLALITAPLFVLGWLAAQVCAVAWLMIAWTITAVQVGWREAGGVRGRRRGSS